MTELLTNNIPIALLVIELIAVIMTVLYLFEYNKRRNLQKSGEKVLEEFRQKGLESLHQAIEKSQQILSNSQMEGIKVVSDSKFSTAQLEKQYQNKLKDLILQSQQSITQIQDQFLRFMTDLQKRSEEFEIASKQAGQQRINQLFENLENKLSDFLITTETKTTTSIELELKAARELIDTYKNQQFKLIDENIIAMMEQTLNIVLAKKLSLKDQLDLVYEGLEKAKVEKFIV